MNEMNELEIQLSLWAPRRPSAKLERRIFPPPKEAPADNQSAITSHASAGFRLRWLAPATAALLLLCIIFNQREGGIASGSTNSSAMVAMILSNQSVAAYLPAGLQREQNWPPTDTFEWTNGSGSTSSVRSFSPPRAQN